MIRLLLAIFALILTASSAESACQVAASTLTLTASSSYTVRAGTVGQSSASASFACNGSLITLLGNNYARATVSSANGFTLRSGGDAIPYSLSADAGGTRPITEGMTINYLDSSLLSLLGILGSNTLTPKFYATPGAGANVAAGVYTDTLSVHWEWSICHGIGLGGLCTDLETGAGNSAVTVTLSVSKDCRVIAPDIAFASAPLASQFTQISQAVAVDCTRNANYTVAFSAGDNGSARPWRAMSDTLGNKLQYNIYRPDGATIWDESNPMAGALPGAGALTPAQMQSYVAKVNPTQTTPPVGHYQDTVSVIVSF